MAEEAVARLTIREAGEWTEEGRKGVAEWLRAQADSLEKDGAKYSGLFTARYITTSEDENG